MTAEYLRIEPDQEWVLANGGVELQHETARLSAPSLMYLLNESEFVSIAARYTEGATIVDEGWTVTSRYGHYRTATETLELGGQVKAVNDSDTLRSDSLHWMRTESRYRFLGATEWMGTDVHFSCLSGDIVMNDEPLGWLAGQVKVDDGEGTVQGDSLSWGSTSSEVWGHVVLAQSVALEPCTANTPFDKTTTALRWSLETTNKGPGFSKLTKVTPFIWQRTPFSGRASSSPHFIA